MFKKLLVVILTLGILLSCKDENVDCALVLCAPGDAIRLELINNGANVISNGTYDETNISVDGDLLENLQIRVLPNVQGATSGLLELNNFDWRPGEYAYTVALGSDWIIDLMITFGLTGNDPCCGDRLIITDLNAGDFSVERRTYSSFYTIILE